MADKEKTYVEDVDRSLYDFRYEDADSYKVKEGLTEDIVSQISEEKDDPDRGISLIPYRRIGSKGGFMMPIALNEKGAAALGMKPGEYKVSYHAGPILVPSTNAVPDAKVEVWAPSPL